MPAATVFVDTSALYAHAADADANHERACTCAENLTAERATLWTGTHALFEFWLLVDCRFGAPAADEQLRALLDSGIAVIEPSVHDLKKALLVGEKFGDQNFSLADRISFAVMERLDRRRAWTYDRDFAVYRYGSQGELAFEITQ